MKSPIFRPSSIILILLSLSIGWGIRGNYGHEYGAMLAGALAGMAAALMSGREDWRQRLPYFAFFGALGWGFGGSIAYMHPPSYTQTGHLPTQVYGFASTYFEAFLWAALGGAGTAYAATEEPRETHRHLPPVELGLRVLGAPVCAPGHAFRFPAAPVCRSGRGPQLVQAARPALLARQ